VGRTREIRFSVRNLNRVGLVGINLATRCSLPGEGWVRIERSHRTSSLQKKAGSESPHDQQWQVAWAALPSFCSKDVVTGPYDNRLSSSCSKPSLPASCSRLAGRPVPGSPSTCKQAQTRRWNATSPWIDATCGKNSDLRALGMLS
jgi:hypothetical protein